MEDSGTIRKLGSWVKHWKYITNGLYLKGHERCKTYFLQPKVLVSHCSQLRFCCIAQDAFDTNSSLLKELEKNQNRDLKAIGQVLELHLSYNWLLKSKKSVRIVLVSFWHLNKAESCETMAWWFKDSKVTYWTQYLYE